MLFKRLLTTLIAALFFQLSYADQIINLHSPDGNIHLGLNRKDNGDLVYKVTYKGKTVVDFSGLGFKFKSPEVSLLKFDLIKADSSAVDETWKPVWGEQSSIRNKYKQIILNLNDHSGSGIMINIIFRVFNDGVGFRYEFPLQPHLKYFVIADELTQFNMAGDHKTFWIPGDYDENEYAYTTSKLSEVDGWKLPILSNNPKEINEPDQYAVQTPLMMKTNDGLCINIHEAALVHYPSMQLHVNRQTYSLSCSLVPNALGDKAYMRAPAITPWRTIIVSDKATDILASKMILNLNEPSAIQNTAWIKPMKFIGVWWEMQTNKSGWNYSDNADSLDAKGNLIPNHRHGANTANVKRYIDFAAKNGIKGLLVEGWNTGWEEWFGNWYGHHFDFVTPYPDFDVKAITAYSKQKGVQMIMHNETSGDASTYERQMDTAFRFMNKYGYTSVKTGYVGNIIPRGEHHDGQWMVDHYVRAATKAAQYKVMIDMHEPVRPTGLSRTYPNWLACEAGRGNEWNAFSDGNLPEHETIMPFTRMMGGPMDYTPGIFKIKGYSTVPGRQVHTTLAKQLALYITMYSPLQMAADLPENYEAHIDAFQFIKDVAVDWDDTKVLDAEPGDYIIIARKAKGKDNWFIGAITDENARSFTTSLSFLDAEKKYTAAIYRDGDNADWKNNPEEYVIEKFIVDAHTMLKLKLAPGGGTAVSLMPATADEAKRIKKYN
jgi:glucan 1,4-alpha-glucosidase